MAWNLLTLEIKELGITSSLWNASLYMLWEGSGPSENYYCYFKFSLQFLNKEFLSLRLYDIFLFSLVESTYWQSYAGKSRDVLYYILCMYYVLCMLYISLSIVNKLACRLTTVTKDNSVKDKISLSNRETVTVSGR